MIKIAICDDESFTCQQIEGMIQESSLASENKVDVDIFYTGEGLIRTLASGMEYDFVILDIELEQLNGIEVGIYIRDKQRNFHTQIIYISSNETYAMQLFTVQPLDFLVKPIVKEKLVHTIQKGLKMISYSEELFMCKVGRDHIAISCKEILYFMSDKRKIKIVCKDEEIDYYGKLSDTLKLLPDCFAQIHNSYVVNMNAIKKSTRDFVIMNNGDCLQISKKYRESFAHQLLERWAKLQG